MINLFNYKYLSNEELKGFSNYKYSSIDNSPLAVYVSHPFWNQVVKLYPMWLAPNVLTFGGMVLVLSAFGLVSAYDYDFHASDGPAAVTKNFLVDSSSPNSTDVFSAGTIPNWVWLYCCLATFLAHIMDGTDGKQARRTGASGPTGELFDHGIDSWMTIPFTITFFSAFGRTDFSINVFRQMLVLMSVQLVFVTTHWEKYNTGVLFLSWCYDASQYGLVLMYFVTWLAGGHMFWKFYLIPNLVTPAQLAEFLFYFSCFGVSIPMSLYNINKILKTGSCKQPNLYEAMLPMFSVCMLFTGAILWALYSPNDILELDPRMYFWAFGTTFSNIACRLIIAQMTSTRCQTLNTCTIGYCIVATGCMVFGSKFGPGLELFVLRSIAVILTAAHVHYAICVVRQMCDYFDINCFTIKKKAPIQSKNHSQISAETCQPLLLNEDDGTDNNNDNDKISTTMRQVDTV